MEMSLGALLFGVKEPVPSNAQYSTVQNLSIRCSQIRYDKPYGKTNVARCFILAIAGENILMDILIGYERNFHRTKRIPPLPVLVRVLHKRGAERSLSSPFPPFDILLRGTQPVDSSRYERQTRNLGVIPCMPSIDNCFHGFRPRMFVPLRRNDIS